MKPASSLPHLQLPDNCPYPEPDRSSPYPPHPTSWRFILILSSQLRLGLPSGLIPSSFPNKKPVYTSPFPHRCYMPRQSHSSRHVYILKYISHKSPSIYCCKLLLNDYKARYCDFFEYTCDEIKNFGKDRMIKTSIAGNYRNYLFYKC